MSGAERRTTSAGGLGVRVFDSEATTINFVGEIDLGTRQIPQADRINIQPHAVRFEDLIGLRVAGTLFDHQTILKTGAAAPLHKHPETATGLLF